MKLPQGTWIVFSSKAQADQFHAVAINETKPGPNPTTVILTQDLDVISQAYMETRDEAELTLHAEVDALKAELKDKAVNGK